MSEESIKVWIVYVDGELLAGYRDENQAYSDAEGWKKRGAKVKVSVLWVE